MRAGQPAAPDIDAYIARFAPEVQEILRRVRAVIREAAPDATEAIKYEIPTFVLHGNLVHFAAFTNHLGFYPTPAGIEAFQEELAPYAAGKGTIRFPLDQPIPYDLIRRVVEQRVKESLASAEAKKRKK
ncbi:MAG: hypothetical protein GXY76_10070 [Chloroflexi bacterium]|nr:hypothetical protein [Chloroflexota bacterium]